jgi:hypothetical protein
MQLLVLTFFVNREITDIIKYFKSNPFCFCTTIVNITKKKGHCILIYFIIRPRRDEERPYAMRSDDLIIEDIASSSVVNERIIPPHRDEEQE